MRRFISLVTLICFVFMTLVAPVARAGYFNPTWVPWDVSAITKVEYPLDNWQLLASVSDKTQSTNDLQMYSGEYWITLGNESAGMLGLSSDQVANIVRSFPENAPMVFARYVPQTAKLRIDVVKVEKNPYGKIQTFVANFTPWHGERWKAGRKYLTASEAIDVYRAGRNPFEKFKNEDGDRTDGNFHNVSWSAAQVAVGHAMRHYNAFVGVIALADTRMTQKQSKSGGVFKKKITTTVKGFVKPKWFLATPVEVQPRGTMAAICAGDPHSDGTCDPEMVAWSGVSVEEHAGGSFPAVEDELYTWSHTESKWTLGAFMLVVAVIAGFAAPLLMGVGSAAHSGFVFSGTSAAVGGGAYAAGSIITNGGSLAAPLNGPFGDGVLADAGEYRPPQASTTQESEFAAKVDSRMVDAPTQSITGFSNLYAGKCDPAWTTQQCAAAGQEPGFILRTDHYAQENVVKHMRVKYENCKARGLRGAELRKCAAPKRNVVDDVLIQRNKELVKELKK